MPTGKKNEGRLIKVTVNVSGDQVRMVMEAIPPANRNHPPRMSVWYMSPERAIQTGQDLIRIGQSLQ